MQVQDKEIEKPQAKETPIAVSSSVPNWPAGIVVSKKENMSVSVSQDLAVILTDSAFKQLFGWAYSTVREISCLGSVSRDGNRFIVERFYLLKQSGSSASTELDQDAVAELMESLIAEGKLEEAKQIKCWAHSHPNMDTFWSTTDDATCRLLVNDYLISIVVGSNFQVRCRIDIAAPVPAVFDNIPVIYQMPKDDLLMEKYAQEVGSAVSEKLLNLPNTQDKEKSVRDKFVPETYCGYCGNWHAEGECPLGDAKNWPGTLDDDFMF
jgi:proteasome lid subunit RPN8/RPN11